MPLDPNVVWVAASGCRYIGLDMQVPPDLASRLSKIALSSGRSPEAFLREAISRLIESAGPGFALVEERQQPAGFVPQPQTFSVYE
jgi:hypothetical protein